MTLVKLTKVNVTLIDFSISIKAPRNVDLDSHECRGGYGTKRYRCPEMVFNAIWNRSVDTFALGVIILEMTHGKRIMPKSGAIAKKYKKKLAKSSQNPSKKNKEKPENESEKGKGEGKDEKDKYDPLEVCPYLLKMAKVFMGIPSKEYMASR